jgi:filamentous hemagglutinin
METPMVGDGSGDESPDLQKVADTSSENAEPKTDTKELPATTEESIMVKLRTYLLDLNHKDGGSKAVWFGAALGFNQGNVDALAKQIIFDPATAIQTVTTPNGVKFNQIIGIVGNNGRIIDVRFTWIRNNDGVMRLVTGVPAPNRKGKRHV